MRIRQMILSVFINQEKKIRLLAAAAPPHSVARLLLRHIPLGLPSMSEISPEGLFFLEVLFSLRAAARQPHNLMICFAHLSDGHNVLIFFQFLQLFALILSRHSFQITNYGNLSFISAVLATELLFSRVISINFEIAPTKRIQHYSVCVN